MKNTSRTLLVIGLAPMLTFSVLEFAAQEAAATHAPADKIGTSAATIEVMQVPVVAGASSPEVELLRGTLDASIPTDLMLSVTAECALWTDSSSPGGSLPKANVKVWVELDGVSVPVTLDSNGDGILNDPDDGKVVFCNRDFAVDPAAPPPITELFNRAKAANAFNWMALNVGAGTHTIVVKARLDAEVTGSGQARAGVGKRTVFVGGENLAPTAAL